jgi:hypothetical protein
MKLPHFAVALSFLALLALPACKHFPGHPAAPIIRGRARFKVEDDPVGMCVKVKGKLETTTDFSTVEFRTAPSTFDKEYEIIAPKTVSKDHPWYPATVDGDYWVKDFTIPYDSTTHKPPEVIWVQCRATTKNKERTYGYRTFVMVYDDVQMYEEREDSD